MLELEHEAPVAFSKAVRKEYPTYELLRDVKLNPGSVAQTHAHAFRSRGRRWTVTVRAAAVSLETSDYDSYGESAQRVDYVLKAAERTIDTDFFTRVGLRYINTVPFRLGEIGEWVNPALVGPLAEGVFGSVDEHWQRVAGVTDVGGYTFQHGLALRPDSSERDYVLDFYKQDVPVAAALDVVNELHALEFSMFCWSLGDAARRHLGPSTSQ
ncbi:MAG: TIGR04255 family protein [Polyangiaceae bacterium]|nr:TIGR04255 family protein [Polyangiaceae bacterium]